MNTEKKILVQAIELFRRNGYYSTSMNMVSEACGISKGNLTYHYPTKEELFKSCIKASSNYFKQYVVQNSFEHSVNELEGLITFLENVKTWLATDNQVTGCIFSNAALELRHTNPELAELSYRHLQDIKSALREKIESGQSSGSITDRESPEDLIEDLFLAYEGAVMYSRIENSLNSFSLFIERIYRNFKPNSVSVVT